MNVRWLHLKPKLSLSTCLPQHVINVTRRTTQPFIGASCHQSRAQDVVSRIVSTMIIHVKVGKDKRDLDVAHNATLSQVASLVTNTFDGDLSVSSLTLLFKGRAFKPGQSKQDADTILHNAGVNTSAAKRSKSHVLLCCGNSPTAGCDIRRSLKPGQCYMHGVPVLHDPCCATRPSLNVV